MTDASLQWFPVWNGSYWDINTANDRYAPTVAAVWAHDGKKEVEYRARLIAAAPEMLDYCKLMAANGDPDAIELVAKAEGQR